MKIKAKTKYSKYEELLAIVESRIFEAINNSDYSQIKQELDIFEKLLKINNNYIIQIDEANINDIKEEREKLLQELEKRFNRLMPNSE